MTKFLTISLIVIAGTLGISAYYFPLFFVENDFLKQFINHELLNILAVIMAITTASVANIHLAFNRIEETIKKAGAFKESRREINKSAFWLIGLFLFSVIILIIRSKFLTFNHTLAFFNAICLGFLFLSILILIDITVAVFSIPPFIKKDENE